MPVKRFPDPRQATEDGIVALGGDLHPDSLTLAYSQGIFPWPVKGLPLAWFCPEERAILDFNELHIPRSLVKARKNTTFRFTIDQAFEPVIRACAEVRREEGTWITEEMIEAYIDYHREGHAHSVEAWEGSRLVGGIYGVDAGGAFAGESMFYLEPNASKLALLHLVDHLRRAGSTGWTSRCSLRTWRSWAPASLLAMSSWTDCQGLKCES